MQESRLQRKNDRPMASGLASPFSTGEASRTSGFEAQVWGGRIRRRREVNATRTKRTERQTGERELARLFLGHDSEKWGPVFRENRAHMKSMIPKSGNRFSEKIMLQ